MSLSDQNNNNNNKRSNNNNKVAVEAETTTATATTRSLSAEEGQFSDGDEDGDDGNDRQQIHNNQCNYYIHHHDEDQLPHVLLMGNNANLAPLRQESTRKHYFEQRSSSHVHAHAHAGDNNDNDNINPAHPQQPIMSNPIKCRLQWGIEEVQGEVFISSCQVCFVETPKSLTTKQVEGEEQEQETEPRDLAIGATCITLHAMTEEPELAIYLQLNENNYEGDDNVNYGTVDLEEDDDDDNEDDNNIKEDQQQENYQSTNNRNISEVTITPLDPNTCQKLFDGLCKLVSKHPLDLDDEDNSNNGGGGGGNGMFGGFGFAGSSNDNDDDDDMVWAPSGGFVDPEGNGGGAADEERLAMLERLDNLLIVNPPEYDEYDDDIQDDGQFDDADE